MNYFDQSYFIYSNISVVHSWRVKLYLFGSSGEQTPSYIPYLSEHSCTGSQGSTTKTTSGILND